VKEVREEGPKYDLKEGNGSGTPKRLGLGQK